jgi:hypothetical protein
LKGFGLVCRKTAVSVALVVGADCHALGFSGEVGAGLVASQTKHAKEIASQPVNCAQIPISARCGALQTANHQFIKQRYGIIEGPFMLDSLWLVWFAIGFN